MKSEKVATPAPKLRPLREGFGDLVRQFTTFLRVLWSSDGRRTLTLLTIGIISVICATAVGQIILNAWNKPFYDAIQGKDFERFVFQLGVFAVIAAGLLILNVAQAWLREMIKVSSREWLSRDLFDQWLKPGRAMRLAYVGEIGVNPDQRIHEDTRNLAERSADLGVGFFQASLLLASFIGVLWTLSGPLIVPIGDRLFTIPGYMVWAALIYAAAGSWLTWLVGYPLVGINTERYQRESELRFALVQANQHAESIAHQRTEEREKDRLKLDLGNVLAMMRQTVTATARLTWITAGYGWVSIVAPIVIAAPAYFGGKLTFGELMMVVGGFYQVNQSLRWFVDNFAQVAEWRATLIRVMSFRETLLTFEDKLAAGEQIEYAEGNEGRLAFENVGLRASGERAKLDADRLDVKPGERVLVVDKTQGRTPLLPAIAGQWPWGSGKLQRPAGDNVMFLTLQPYFPKGSLRAALAYPSDASEVSDEAATAALERVGLDHLARKLDRTARWWRKLTDDEQARLALARVLVHKPRWVLCDGLSDAMAWDYRELVTSIFDRELADAALISIGRRDVDSPLCKRVVHLMSGEEAFAPGRDGSSRLPHPAET